MLLLLKMEAQRLLENLTRKRLLLLLLRLQRRGDLVLLKLNAKRLLATLSRKRLLLRLKRNELVLRLKRNELLLRLNLHTLLWMGKSENVFVILQVDDNSVQLIEIVNLIHLLIVAAQDHKVAIVVSLIVVDPILLVVVGTIDIVVVGVITSGSFTIALLIRQDQGFELSILHSQQRIFGLNVSHKGVTLSTKDLGLTLETVPFFFELEWV